MYQVTDTPGAALNTIYAEDINQFARSLTAQADPGLISLLGPTNTPTQTLTSALQAGGLTGAYQWAWYWITGDLDGTGAAHVVGRTTLSPLTAAQTLASQESTLTLPSSVTIPTGAIGWGLARNKNGSTTMYVVVEQFANLSGAMANAYTDNVADASLATLAPILNTTGGLIAGINALAHGSALTALCHFENTVDTTRGVRGTFTRSSAANNPATLATVANNVPCYVNGKFGQAITIWEGTTNLVYNSDFETATTTATVFSDPITSGTAWTVQSGSFTYSSSGATSGAAGSLITAGNAAWKPLLGSDGTTSLALTAQAVFTEPSTVSTNEAGALFLRIDGNNFYECYFNNANFYLIKFVGGTGTSLSSVAQTISASTTYTITLALDYQGHLTAKLYSGSGTGGTLLQTLTATDTSLSGGFLIGVGGDTGVIVNNASMQAPWANGWNVSGVTQYTALYPSDKMNGAYAMQISADGAGGGSATQGTINQNPSALTSGTVYAVSFYAKLLSGSSQLHTELYGSTGATNVTVTNQWQRYTAYLTASTTSTLYFWLTGAGSILIDAVQIEPKSYPTPYYRNDSTSASATRSAETLTYPANLLTPSQGTVAFWWIPGVSTSASPATDSFYLFTYGTPGTDGIFPRFSNGVVNFASSGVASPPSYSGGWTVGTPLQIVSTWQNGQVSFYVAGVLVGSCAYTTPVNPPAFQLGDRSGYTQGNSGFDELAFFNRALTPAEVYSLYAATQPLIDAHETPIAPDTQTYNSTSSSPDANDVYTVVTYTRRDGTKYMVSTLSGTVSPSGSSNYPTLTWQYYDATGTVVTRTQTFALTYDSSGKRTGVAMTN